MARKKSGRLAAQKFRERAEEIAEFALDVAESGVSDQYITWAYDFAIIRLYREFEDLMLEALIVAINNDTATISQRTGLVFPKHLTDEVCEFLILGTGYFDFKGRDGLLRKLQEFLPGRPLPRRGCEARHVQARNREARRITKLPLTEAPCPRKRP